MKEGVIFVHPLFKIGRWIVNDKRHHDVATLV